MNVSTPALGISRLVLRLVGLVVVVALVGGVTAAVALAVAPHGRSLVTAVEGEREEQTLQLEEGAQRSKMYDQYGGLMTILRDAEDREWVQYEQLSDTVIWGVLAVEDADFFEHDGVDWLATIRAASENVAAGSITQGGSTITQQIVKLSIVGDEQTLERKIREAMLAQDLEKQYSKEEILEYYLNTIYFGNSAYVVQAAAEVYFGKNAEDLDYGDMALLAGFIRSPGVFTFSDPDIDFARLRRARSVERYLEEGLITEEEAAEIQERTVPTFTRSQQETELQRDYFAEEVVQTLLEMPELGETREARRVAVFQGGLKIYTTFEPDFDENARDAVEEVFGDPSGPEPFAVSLASIDPETGAIRALLGGNEFETEQFNLATQGLRQPGSSFKTYVLTTAFEMGAGPNDAINGRGPCAFDDGGNEPYVVNNFGGSGGSLGSLRSQTLASSNCAFVRLGLVVGLENVVETTSRMIGLDEGRLLPYPSMSLGAQELTPLEQAIGYAVIANDGVRMDPYLITRIEDRAGNVIYEHVPTGRRVISEETARNVADVLEGNVRGGTGTRARLASGQPAGGKTGTAQNFEDAWFVGITPQLATAVWMGHPEEKIPMTPANGLDRSVTGGSYPAMVWNAFMSRALDGAPIEEFPAAPSLGRGDLLFLEDETCPVSIRVGDQVQTVNVSCALVDFFNGGFGFSSDAVCRGYSIPVGTDEAGNTLYETRDVRCQDLERLLNPTTTVEETTTTTSEPPPTTDGGGPGSSTTTTRPPGSTTSTTAPATTTSSPATTSSSTTTSTSTPPASSSSTSSSTSSTTSTPASSSSTSTPASSSSSSTSTPASSSSTSTTSGSSGQGE